MRTLKMNLILSSGSDFLQVFQHLFSPNKLLYMCTGTRDVTISEYIISSFTVKHKSNRRIKSIKIELTENDCREFDLSYIRTTYWSRLNIDENLKSKLHGCMANEETKSTSELQSSTSSSSLNSAAVVNILGNIKNDETLNI